MISESNIKLALDTALLACAAANNLPAVLLENQKQTTQLPTPFLQATMLPANPVDLSITAGGNVEYRGIYHINLFYPNPSATGSTDAMATSDILINYFKKGSVFTSNGVSVFIIEPPASLAPRVIQNYYQKPVRIIYNSIQHS